MSDTTHASPLHRAAAALSTTPVPMQLLLQEMCADLGLMGAAFLLGQGAEERCLGSVGRTDGDSVLVRLPTAVWSGVHLYGPRPREGTLAPWVGILSGALAKRAGAGGDPMERMHSAGALMRAMAHDLRNLIGVFDQNIQFVQQALEEVEEELPDTIEEDIEQVQEANERVLSYVQRVHELAHILQGPWNPEAGSDVFAQGIEGVPEAAESRVRRLIEVEAGLPDVRIDAPRVKLLAKELLANVEYSGASQATLRVASTPPENPLVQAWAASLPAGPHVFLSCTDDGSGMDAFVLSRCGEPMFSHPPGVDRPGLGFSLIQSILGAVGGQMSVTAVRGKGSSVTLAVPAAVHPGPVSAGEVVPLVPESERLKVAVRLAESPFRDWLLETLVDAQFVVVPSVSEAAVLIADHDGASQYPGPPMSFFFIGSRMPVGIARPDALMPEKVDRAGLIRRLSMAVARRANKI